VNDERWPDELEELVRPVHPGAPARLSYQTCGSEVEPVVTKPKRGTADWWDDPAPYVACPSGHFLAWMSVDEDRYYHWPSS
jgi:hypothetical protein